MRCSLKLHHDVTAKFKFYVNPSVEPKTGSCSGRRVGRKGPRSPQTHEVDAERFSRLDQSRRENSERTRKRVRPRVGRARERLGTAEAHSFFTGYSPRPAAQRRGGAGRARLDAHLAARCHHRRGREKGQRGVFLHPGAPDDLHRSGRSLEHEPRHRPHHLHAGSARPEPARDVSAARRSSPAFSPSSRRPPTSATTSRSFGTNIILREIISVCTEGARRSYDEQDDVDNLLDEVEQKIFAIGEDRFKDEIFSMKDQVMDAIDAIEELYQQHGGITGLATGFTDFDRLTSGLHAAEMIVIAARPSMGKTALAMNIAEHVAVNEGQAGRRLQPGNERAAARPAPPLLARRGELAKSPRRLPRRARFPQADRRRVQAG